MAMANERQYRLMQGLSAQFVETHAKHMVLKSAALLYKEPAFFLMSDEIRRLWNASLAHHLQMHRYAQQSRCIGSYLC